MTGCEKFLEVLKVVGQIASTLLNGLEEFRKIQECKTFRENRRNGVKYLPAPRQHHYKKRNKRSNRK